MKEKKKLLSRRWWFKSTNIIEKVSRGGLENQIIGRRKSGQSEKELVSRKRRVCEWVGKKYEVINQ